jgi:hypothetical protein|nr:hypothetical protein [uncultured Aggregatibacter sp.]
MKFKVTLRSSVPFTRLGELSKSIEVEADSIEKAKRLGHTLIAMENGKAYPISGVSVTAEEI